jgi:hypothetical protein
MWITKSYFINIRYLGDTAAIHFMVNIINININIFIQMVEIIYYSMILLLLLL